MAHEQQATVEALTKISAALDKIGGELIKVRRSSNPYLNEAGSDIVGIIEDSVKGTAEVVARAVSLLEYSASFVRNHEG